MGNVRFQVTGQIRDLERANDKLNRDFAKLTEQLAKMREEGAKGQRQQVEGNRGVLDGLKRQTAELGSMVTQYVTIQGAVQLVTAAYRDWRREIEATAASTKTFNENLVRTLTETGDLLQTGAIERQLKSIRNATDEQARAAFEGVSGGAPMASLERRLALTRQVAQQAPTGVDLEQLGNLVGELERISPGLAPDDVADIATKLRATAGNKIREVGGKQFVASVENLMRSGFERDEALGFATAGLQGGVSSEFFTSLAGKLQGARDPALEGKTVAEQIRALQSDAALAQRTLGVEQATKLNLIDLDAARTIATEITRAQRQDFAQVQLRAIRGSVAGTTALAGQRSQELSEDLMRPEALAEVQRQDIMRQVTAQATARGGLPLRMLASLGNMLSEFGISTAEAASTTGVGQLIGAPFRAGRELGGRLRSGRSRTPGEIAITSAESVGAVSGEQAEEMRRAEKQRNEQIMILRDIRDGSSRVNNAANVQLSVGAE